jgi:hypothetical protein
MGHRIEKSGFVSSATNVKSPGPHYDVRGLNAKTGRHSPQSAKMNKTVGTFGKM